MVQKGNLAKFDSSNISESREATPTKIGFHALGINPYLHEFFEPIPIDSIFHNHGPKGKFSRFEGKQKVVISPKPKRPHPPKLVCMHFTSTSTCMNFLSRFYFLTPMDYSPWSEGKIWPF